MTICQSGPNDKEPQRIGKNIIKDENRAKTCKSLKKNIIVTERRRAILTDLNDQNPPLSGNGWCNFDFKR